MRKQRKEKKRMLKLKDRREEFEKRTKYIQEGIRDTEEGEEKEKEKTIMDERGNGECHNKGEREREQNNET